MNLYIIMTTYSLADKEVGSLDVPQIQMGGFMLPEAYTLVIRGLGFDAQMRTTMQKTVVGSSILALIIGKCRRLHSSLPRTSICQDLSTVL